MWGEEKSSKILEKDFIKSWTKGHTLSKERNKLKETMENKISKFTTSIAEKGKHIASLEAELKRAREEYEA
jgi:septal ring factor EnvC (AmiA/AmiB activator)